MPGPDHPEPVARGRERLKGRLERRGLAPSAAIFASAFSFDKGKVIVPVSLRGATAAAALRFMSGEGTAAGEGPAAALAREVLRAMYFGTLNTIAKLVFLLGAIGASGWPAGFGTTTSPPRARRRLAPSGQARSLLKRLRRQRRMKAPSG